MRKTRAEMPSNPQQNDLGMESNASLLVDVATITGDAGAMPPGCRMRGWVLVMFTVGRGAAAGLGRMVMRAVSFFGPRSIEESAGFSKGAGAAARAAGSALVPGTSGKIPLPGGFGRGRRIGDVADVRGGKTGGRRRATSGVSLAAPLLTVGGGVIDGGDRRGGMAGVREGRTMRAVSRSALPGTTGLVAGLGGNAIRTVSFFGSAMTEHVALEKNR